MKEMASSTSTHQQAPLTINTENISDMKSEAKRLLNDFFQMHSDDLPAQRIKSEWQAENRRGFLLGLIEEGQNKHVEELVQLLRQGTNAQEQLEFSRKDSLALEGFKPSFLDRMFLIYIIPFHKSYTEDFIWKTLHLQQVALEEAQENPSTEEAGSSKRSSTESLQNPVLKKLALEDKPSRGSSISTKKRNFKKALVERDGVCLFCWRETESEGAHIIAQKNSVVPIDESDALQRSNLQDIYQVQNGLLLCSNCHGVFDKLRCYVDIIDNKMVVKYVNQTNDPGNLKWQNELETILLLRKQKKRYFIAADKYQKEWNEVEANGDMALYFADNDPNKRPSETALRLHKTACLIWRLAGGAEPDDDDYSDDDDDDVVFVDVDYASKKRNIKQWLEKSCETLAEKDPSL